MKKIVINSLLFAALAFSTTGCLKDKGFDNHTYGINDPDTQPQGVGFPAAASAKNTIGLNAFTATPQPVDDLVYVNFESGTPASSEITITLQVDDNMRVAYNTANGTNIAKLPANLYTLPLTVTIPAGGRGGQVPITVLNTNTLSPDSSYGVGVKLSGVSNGYKIASNLSNLFIEFVIKNKYDGRYNLKGYHNRPGLDLPYNETVYMVTTGANSISMYWPALGSYAHPLNGGATYYGTFTANFTFDPATNKLTAWDWTPYATTLPTAIGPATDSRYDPATKKIYANFYYNNNPSQRGFLDTLTYLGPRP